MAETKEFPRVDVQGATYTPKNILVTGGAGAFIMAVDGRSSTSASAFRTTKVFLLV